MILVFLLLVPLIGAIACAVMPKPKSARQMALFFSLITLLVAIIAAFQFYAAPADRPIDLGFTGPALTSIGFSFHLGVDAVSLWLIVLTAFLQPLAVAASFGSIHERQKEYYAWMMALLVAMLGVFVSKDALLFYVFFELTLVPMFFIIGIWGGPERRFAAGKFFLFTFSGSVFTLAAAVYLGLKAGSFDISAIVHTAQGLTAHERFWVVMGFLAGFAVKVPLFPVHTWLPLAHTEAPTAGSVILAGVLLKLGTYGLFRLALPIGLIGPPDANGFTTAAFPRLNMWLGVLCVIGIIYGALVAWVQQDIKKLVAYSSVSHLGFCVLGLVAMNDIGIQGSVLYMINHGINTGALFLCIGMIYDRYHTRDINALSGLARRMPILSFFFILFCLASIGLPGTNGFISEFLTILAAFTSDHLGIAFGSVAALGIVLGAIYILHMAARVIWGPLKVPEVHGLGNAHAEDTHGAGKHGAHDKGGSHGDITGREIAILVPLAIAVIVLGVKPGLVMDRMLGPAQQARDFAALRSTPGPVTPPLIKPAALQSSEDFPSVATRTSQEP